MATRGNRSSGGVSIRNWRGLLTNADPHDLPPGAAQEQNNLQVLAAGKAQVRKGMRAATFANSTTGTAADILATHGYSTPMGEFVLYLNANGVLRVGRTPS